MNNEEKNAANETTAADNDTKGLDYLTRLSYACVDRSDLNYEEKRNLLFALYSFRCLFDTKELKRLSKTTSVKSINSTPALRFGRIK